MDEHTDKRAFTRVRRTTETVLRAGGQSVRGRARDISLKGLFVEGEPLWPVGTEVEVTVMLGAEDDPEWLVEARGSVARVTPEGTGVELRDLIGLESYWNLRSIVLYNAADPEAAEREFASYSGLRPRDQ